MPIFQRHLAVHLICVMLCSLSVAAVARSERCNDLPSRDAENPALLSVFHDGAEEILADWPNVTTQTISTALLQSPRHRYCLKPLDWAIGDFKNDGSRALVMLFNTTYGPCQNCDVVEGAVFKSSGTKLELIGDLAQEDPMYSATGAKSVNLGNKNRFYAISFEVSSYYAGSKYVLTAWDGNAFRKIWEHTKFWGGTWKGLINEAEIPIGEVEWITKKSNGPMVDIVAMTVVTENWQGVEPENGRDKERKSTVSERYVWNPKVFGYVLKSHSVDSRLLQNPDINPYFQDAVHLNVSPAKKALKSSK